MYVRPQTVDPNIVAEPDTVLLLIALHAALWGNAALLLLLQALLLAIRFLKLAVLHEDWRPLLLLPRLPLQQLLHAARKDQPAAAAQVAGPAGNPNSGTTNSSSLNAAATAAAAAAAAADASVPFVITSAPPLAPALQHCVVGIAK